MTSLTARRTFGSGDTLRVAQLKVAAPADVLLIIDDDARAVEQTRLLSEHLGCDLVVVADVSRLPGILKARPPSVTFLALESLAFSAAAALRSLATTMSGCAVILLGDVEPRLLAGVRRLGAAQGFTVIGTLPRSFDPDVAERLCVPHLGAPPEIPRMELERALHEHEFSLVYQPKMSICAEGLRMAGVEAFVRWQHPRRGLLRPSHFLSSLEHEDLLVALMDFVMQEAVRQTGQWRERGLALQVGINLSPRLVRDREFPERLAALLREYNVPSASIAIDVTEDAQNDRALVLDVFTTLRLLGNREPRLRVIREQRRQAV